MPELPQSIIVGSWRVVRSELPPPLVERYLHFSTGWQHLWEHPFPAMGVPRLCRFHYRMSEHGVFITPANGHEKGWELPFTSDGDSLVFRHPSGKRWWLERIPLEKRPDFLARYYEPPTETEVA